MMIYNKINIDNSSTTDDVVREMAVDLRQRFAAICALTAQVVRDAQAAEVVMEQSCHISPEAIATRSAEAGAK